MTQINPSGPLVRSDAAPVTSTTTIPPGWVSRGESGLARLDHITLLERAMAGNTNPPRPWIVATLSNGTLCDLGSFDTEAARDARLFEIAAEISVATGMATYEEVPDEPTPAAAEADPAFIGPPAPQAAAPAAVPPDAPVEPTPAPTEAQ